MQNILIYLLVGALISLSGCAIHKPDVQQGNIMEPEALAQLHAGLTQKQVQFLMGTPIIQDPFHPERWDYVYRLKVHNHEPIEHRLTVFFENGVVSRLEPVDIKLPSPASPAAPSPAPPKTSETGPAPQ
jgi:outer membrane protein assembly factor BamE